MVSAYHYESIAIWGVAIVRSGEVGFPCEGILVGVSRLRRTRSLLSVRESMMLSPLAAALASLVCEYHAALWALKSPRMMESPRA